ncbi:hypothetical protein V6N13_109030 [Hibiscus sabdariffa]
MQLTKRDCRLVAFSWWTIYVDNDELRELPYKHVFHVECIDKWLKINATHPLCKSKIGETSSASSLIKMGKKRSVVAEEAVRN